MHSPDTKRVLAIAGYVDEATGEPDLVGGVRLEVTATPLSAEPIVREGLLDAAGPARICIVLHDDATHEGVRKLLMRTLDRLDGWMAVLHEDKPPRTNIRLPKGEA